MGAKEKATFELALSLIKWEPLYRLDSCNEKYVYSRTFLGRPPLLPSKSDYVPVSKVLLLDGFSKTVL